MRNTLVIRSARGAALAAVIVLAAAATAAAGTDEQKVHLTAQGKAAAGAVVLKRSDLGPVAGWTGGPQVMKETSACKGLEPRQDDLVLTGKASSKFEHKASLLSFASQASVLQTPAMVQTDWNRTMKGDLLIRCLRSAMRGAGKSVSLVSIKQIGMPGFAKYHAAYRILFDVKAPKGGQVHFLLDTLLVGRGRTEITLTTTSLLADQAVVWQAELRLASALVGRIRV